MTARRKFDLHIQSPRIRDMKKHHLEHWKSLARAEGNIISLRNGLDIFPCEGFEYAIDYKVALRYDADFEYRKLMNKIKNKLNGFDD